MKHDLQLLGRHVSSTWQDGVEDTEDHRPQIQKLQTDAAELRDAQPHEHVVGITEAAQDLRTEGRGLNTSDKPHAVQGKHGSVPEESWRPHSSIL